MRKLAITLALASSAIASPALALDHAWYVGVEGGAMIVEDTSFNYSLVRNGVTVVNAPKGITVDHKTGIDADLIGGYDFGMFRAEAEIGYKRAGIKDVVTNGVPNVAAGTYNADGHASVISSMGNLMLDFGDDSGWNGYVGGGLGIARVKYDVSVPALGASVFDRDSRLAWQAIAGVRKSISPNIDLGVKYRYFNVSKLRFNDAFGGSYRARFRSHSLLASLIFNFAPPPPPPPPPPPMVEAPPPPPPTQTCPDGSVILATDTCPPVPEPYVPPPAPPEPAPERG